MHALRIQVWSQISHHYPYSAYFCCYTQHQSTTFSMLYTRCFSFPGCDFDTVTHYCCQVISTSETVPENKKKKVKPPCKHFPLALAHYSGGEAMRITVGCSYQNYLSWYAHFVLCLPCLLCIPHPSRTGRTRWALSSSKRVSALSAAQKEAWCGFDCSIWASMIITRSNTAAGIKIFDGSLL